MPCILNIETATEICSVALSHDGEIVFEKESSEERSHASVLGVFVDEALKFTRQSGLNIDAVAVSSGPGSYTGLRIGVSEAKGLCYGLRVPLIAIKTLDIMAHHIIETKTQFSDMLFCPMIDARRMEVYAAIFNNKMDTIRETAADIVNEDAYIPFLEQSKIVFFGNGSHKCKDFISHPNSIFIDNVFPKARYMLKLSERAFAQNSFVDVAYFEPFYLKDFVTTVAKNKIF